MNSDGIDAAVSLKAFTLADNNEIDGCCSAVSSR